MDLKPAVETPVILMLWFEHSTYQWFHDIIFITLYLLSAAT